MRRILEMQLRGSEHLNDAYRLLNREFNGWGTFSQRIQGKIYVVSWTHKSGDCIEDSAWVQASSRVFAASEKLATKITGTTDDAQRFTVLY